MKELDIGDMKWWAFTLLLLGGVTVFILLYALCQTALFSVPERFALISGIVLGAGLLGLYAVLSRFLEKRWPATLNLTTFPSGITAGFLIGVLYFVATTSLIALCGCYKISSISYCSDFVSQVSLFFMVACGEEVIFRGIIFHMIDKRWGFAAALVVSSLLFGGMHILNDGATVWSSVAIAVEAGLMLGAAYKCGGSLWLPIGIHWSWNLMEGPVLGFPVSGSGINHSIVSPLIKGPDIITGGVFGAEASIFAAALGVAVTLLILREHNSLHHKR